MPVAITINGYKFNELSKEAKKKARYYYMEHYFEPSDVTAQFEQDLHAVGTEGYEYCFTDAKVSWSLSCCQGDGVSFTGTWRNEAMIPILNKVYDMKIPRNVVRLIPFLALELKRTNHHYCHEYTVDTEIEVDTGYGYYKRGEGTFKLIEKLVRDIQERVENYRLKVCKELEKYGYAIMDGYESDDYLEDFYKGNGILFDEGGDPI
jgi:hypothetical protein